uniref:LON peptidase N-terminal domain and RING finger protein 3 n=1 Tax=Phallusia mammillata TaxID=59560 RepID=A0A6F9DKB2_9ASCI|nr:LON peptidase N-terminal domain and RING finger protein 3 [Phallusia mammillata]
MTETSVPGHSPGLFASESHALKRFNLKSKVSIKDTIGADVLQGNLINYSRLAKDEIFSKSGIIHVMQDLASMISANYIDFVTINTLLDIIVEMVNSLKQNIFDNMLLDSNESASPDIFMDQLSCQSCCELLYNPTTLLCGHTFCNFCLNGTENCFKNCIVCNKPIQQDKIQLFSGNVTLSAILQKWHPKEWLSRSHTVEGMIHFKKKEYHKAVEKFNQTVDLSPRSHVAYLHRAKAQFCMNDLDLAYQDAWKAMFLARSWPEVHLVLGEILYTQKNLEEALLSFCLCLSNDESNTKAKKRIKEVLTTLVQQRQMQDDGQLCYDTQTHKRALEMDAKSVVSCKRVCSSPERLGKSVLVEDGATICAPEQNDAMFYNDMISQCSSYIHPNINFDDLDSDSTGKTKEVPVLTEEIKKRLKSSLLSIASSLTEAFFATMSLSNSKETSSLLSIQSQLDRKVNADLLDETDFECSLCMRLYYDPVCTPCGHVFCQFCIERCLDHKAVCPLCKQSMKVYLAETLENIHPACDYVTKSLIRHYLPKEYKEREKLHYQEIDELTQTKPIFVCTIAFPSVPCPLHIFEPRYRLMLRRCLDHNQREFGMCMPADKTWHHPIGTLLKVRDVKFFPDGRSVVDSIGYRRFRTSHCEVKDGYNVAKYTYIVDEKVTDPQLLQDLLRLADKVYAAAQEWFGALSSVVSSRITQHFGSFPFKDENINTENGPNWLWWVLAVLPVEERVQATILGKNILRERLLIIHRVLVCLKQKQK